MPTGGAGDPINVYSELEPVYGDATETARRRYETIKAAFVERFGSAPEAYARSPGRVNLIGEHIDYEGYGVLPMALAVDTVVAVRRGCDQLVVCNVDAAKYPEKVFSVDPAQEVDVGKHNWGNYFVAAYKGVFEHLAEKGQQAPAPVGLEIMVHGTVPTGGGLSSSAAIVCASAMAVMRMHGIEFTKGEVAEFTARAERYVGVTSGGMDQAISIMGMPGIAKLVEFNPVRASDVVLPEGTVFVVANSLAVSNKAESATKHYNLRVVECRLAAAALALALGQSREEARKIITLKEVEPLIEAKYSGPKASTSGAQLAAVQELLHDGAYSTGEIEELLGTKLTDLYEGNASALRVLGANDSFELKKRALHVYAEKQRVPDFRDVCNSGAPVDEKMAKLGQLMDESHASCRDLYECSSVELDALVQVNKGAGAIGSRLTGAGWGGCTVSLVRQEDVDAFIEKVKEGYFQGLVAAGRIKAEELGEHIFASKPAAGGAVLNLRL
ncbi:Galactokinase [Chlorella sorokiniana]|uniref:Galactokinase n=1 Tax=Chlorella sorokiniana TaxID=3076 RepID=A0A2P6TYL6_CHLSO|nr:Galactokinase [Chlorella sorokiniana]|eukprot:PRW59155.1 Galactokinase [Chlorella sorokiniana]